MSGGHDSDDDGVRSRVGEAGELRGTDVLNRQVRTRGIRLGRTSDLVVDLEHGRVLGVDVVCGDEATRFLPLAAADIAAGEIDVSSALVLLDDPGAAFYRSRGATLRELRRAELRGGRLVDVAFDESGQVRSVLVESSRGVVRRVSPEQAGPVCRSASDS